jgi:four helix bundle protein
MFRFEELDIWKMGVEYTKRCYSIANNFPINERFALADQLRRAVVSIPTNIAEGSIGSDKEFCSFLNIASRSGIETVSLLIVAEKLGYITMEERMKLYNEAEILIRKIRSLRRVCLNGT